MLWCRPQRVPAPRHRKQRPQSDLDFRVQHCRTEISLVYSFHTIKVKQTEQVTYKLDGLVLLIEGTGRNPDSGDVMFRALATVSYDEAAGVYHFRAYIGAETPLLVN